MIDKYAGLPFRYGQDCCQFVGECIESITGTNPMTGIQYETQAEANAIINRYGNLEDAMRYFLGEPYDGHKDGDACIMDSNAGQNAGQNADQLAAAVIYRDRVVARVEGGLMDYPLDRALMVWCT